MVIYVMFSGLALVLAAVAVGQFKDANKQDASSIKAACYIISFFAIVSCVSIVALVILQWYIAG